MIQLLSLAFSALPLRWALALGRGFASFWYYVVPVRVSVARRNVRRVFGKTLAPREQRRIVRESLASLCMTGVEALRLPSLDPITAQAHMIRHGYEHLEAAIARGKGVLVVTAHIGSFPLLAACEAVRGLAVAAVVKTLASKSVNAFWTDVRERTRLGSIPAKRSKELIKELLGKNTVVALTVDQHMAPHRAVVSSFFGLLASTTPAPTRFALETGAAIVPVVSFRRREDPTMHDMWVQPALEIETPYADYDANLRHNTERINRIVEGWIKDQPGQWLWLHKRFKVHDDPQGWVIPAELLHLK
jgi:Kdo2-lipid IVA lauroyltransferase/acyltransferase